MQHCLDFSKTLSRGAAANFDQAQAFYQTKNDSLAKLDLKCSYASGVCVNYGEYIISRKISVPVSPRTWLAAALFSNNIGYSITYQDINGSVRQLSYANSTKGVVTDWADGNLTTNSTLLDGYALSTAIRVPTNVTARREVVYKVLNIGIQPINSVTNEKSKSILDEKTWVTSESLPHSSSTYQQQELVLSTKDAPIPNTLLPSFTPTNATIATIFFNNWDCLFYIDSSRHLQFMRSTDGGQKWSLQPSADVSAWPLADVADAPIAAAVSSNVSDPSAYVYYASGRRLVQVRIMGDAENTNWLPAIGVEHVEGKANGTDGGPGVVTAMRSEGKGMMIVKIGAGTGAAVLVLLVLSSAIIFCHRRKKRLARERRAIKKEDSIFGFEENDPGHFGFVGKAELSGLPSERSELDHDPACLLLHQLQTKRLAELRAGIPGELGGRAVEPVVGELDASLCRCELDARGVCELASPVVECELDVGGEWSVPCSKLREMAANIEVNERGSEESEDSRESVSCVAVTDEDGKVKKGMKSVGEQKERDFKAQLPE